MYKHHSVLSISGHLLLLGQGRGAERAICRCCCRTSRPPRTITSKKWLQKRPSPPALSHRLRPSGCSEACVFSGHDISAHLLTIWCRAYHGFLFSAAVNQRPKGTGGLPRGARGTVRSACPRSACGPHGRGVGAHLVFGGPHKVRSALKGWLRCPTPLCVGGGGGCA